jgi:hypothetical protein
VTFGIARVVALFSADAVVFYFRGKIKTNNGDENKDGGVRSV